MCLALIEIQRRHVQKLKFKLIYQKSMALLNRVNHISCLSLVCQIYGMQLINNFFIWAIARHTAVLATGNPADNIPPRSF